MDLIQMDIQREAIDVAFIDLRTEIKLLEEQNVDIRSKLKDETTKCFEMTRLLRARWPFHRTKTGEVIFPGKKEMECKLDVVANEMSKLRRVLDGFQRDHREIDSTRETFESFSCPSKKDDTGDNKEIQALDEEYNKMKDTIDEYMLEVSKYRVKLDEVKKELVVNEKRLEETQVDFNETNAKLAQIESDVKNESDKTDGPNLKSELDDVENRLDGLKSVIEYQMDELYTKNKRYRDAIHEKEYQLIRSNNLCKEKARLTSEFETEFNRVKEYFKKRLEHVEYLPSALQAVHEQLAVQKELKTSAEKSIEILSKKLKTITEDPCSDKNNVNSRQLMKLKAQNMGIRNEHNKTEKDLADIENCYDLTLRKINEQNSRLNEIHIGMMVKINEIRSVFKRPTEEYLCTIEKLQNEVAKIEAASCFEDGKQKLVSFVMQEQLDALVNILNDAQEQIVEIENLQKYLVSTQPENSCVPNGEAPE